MNRAGDTYWLSNRGITRRTAVQSLPAVSTGDLPSAFDLKLLRGWIAPIPSWIILGMIILAAFATCSTVIVRSNAELQGSSLQYQRTASEIETLRRANASLQTEIHRIASDPNMIESAARLRLGMVRPNDIVVPIESVQGGSNFGTLSFVR